MNDKKRMGETGEQYRNRLKGDKRDERIPDAPPFIVSRHLLAGTVVHLSGVPVTLVAPVVAEAPEGNWDVIDGHVAPTTQTMFDKVAAKLKGK